MTELTLDITPITPADLSQIEKLDERAFGPGRFTRTAYRLREGLPPVTGMRAEPPSNGTLQRLGQTHADKGKLVCIGF